MVVQHRIIGCLSTLFFGFYAQVLHGETFHLTMVTGKIPSAAIVVGVIVAFRRDILDVLMDNPDYEWLMIDASYIKLHPHAAGAKGGV